MNSHKEKLQKSTTSETQTEQTTHSAQKSENTINEQQIKLQNTTTQSSYISNPFKIIFDGISNMFKYNQNVSIILLIASLFMTGGGFTSGSPDFSDSQASSISSDQIMAILVIFGIVLLLLTPIFIFLYTMYSGIASYTALNTSRQNTITFKEAWKTVLGKFWIILGINVVVMLKVLGGLLLFIIPGIRAMLRYNMVHMFVFDENTGVIESINKSKALAKDHLIEVFGMTFASSLIPFVGGIMAIGGQSVMYPQLKQLKSAPHQKPKVHWLNYLAFILWLIFSLFIALIVLILFLIVKK